MNSQQPNQYLKIPAKGTYETLRSTAYETDKALAEIVDNSIQAKSRTIEIIIVSEKQKVNIRNISKVTELYVCDNGIGMDQDLLTRSICLSESENKNDPDGIGRFGYGLVGASLATCRNLEVWSWQSSIEDANYTQLDFDNDDGSPYVKSAYPKKIDLNADLISEDINQSESGTIVKWTKIDQIDWSNPTFVIKNTSEALGRIYRHLLNKVDISFIVVEEGEVKGEKKFVVKTDPLYLTEGEPTSVEGELSTVALFERYGSPDIEFEIPESLVPESQRGKGKNIVILNASLVRKEYYRLEDGTDAGRKPYGRHANRNQGISIVRADRELLLDSNYLNSDPRDRWWGIEIRFSPQLDSFFGVGKEKQSASLYSRVGQRYKDLQADTEAWKDYKKAMMEDSREGMMIQLFEQIAKIKNSLFAKVKSYGVNRKRGSGANAKGGQTPIEQAEKRASDVNSEYAKDNPVNGLDDVSDTPENIQKNLEQEFIASAGMDEKEAGEKASSIVFQHNNIAIVEVHERYKCFFDVSDCSGVTLLKINKRHPFYQAFYSPLKDTPLQSDDELPDDLKIADLQERIDLGFKAILLILSSWARMEYQASDEIRDQLGEIRDNWGQFASRYLND